MMADALMQNPTAALGPSAGLPISVVATRTGIPQATLRAWQHRYGLGPSRRTEGGHRRYSTADIERLTAVRDMIAQGVPAGEAARLVLEDFGDLHNVGGGLPLEPGTDVQAHQLAMAALDLDGPLVRRHLRSHLARHGITHTWEELLRPVLRAIGDRWDKLPHGVAVEHLLSHVAAAALGGVPIVARGRSEVLLACVPVEEHDLPLVALAAALGQLGITTTLLGAATPPHALTRASNTADPPS